MLLSQINEACHRACKTVAGGSSPQGHCLTFALNGIDMGIDIRVVTEIARHRILEEPQGMLGFIRGLFRHNGMMIPVIDLAACYGKHPLKPGARTCIVLVELGVGKWRRDIGIMVDEIVGVSEFELSELLPVPEVAHRMLQVEIIEGLVKQKENYLIVLDALRLLPDTALEELAMYMRDVKHA